LRSALYIKKLIAEKHTEKLAAGRFGKLFVSCNPEQVVGNVNNMLDDSLLGQISQ